MNPEDQRESRRRQGDEGRLTRRRALRVLGTGAAAATLEATLFDRGALAAATAAPGAPSPASAPSGALHPVALRAQPFDLTEVRLLDGPFKDALERDGRYLLSLDPDRMLHNFRVNAGLPPKAPVYGGWESVATWADIRAHGHTLGHYLTACALMYASTGRDEFKRRCDYVVGDLQECQAAAGTGLVNAFPDNTAQIDNLVRTQRATGVPWYTLHKVFAGLRDAHLHCDDTAARSVLVKLSDWAIATTQSMTDPQFEAMLNTEHGGMNEVLADVYAITGDARYLALAERFSHKLLLEPLSESRDTLDGLHSNTQIPKVVGFLRIHVLTGEPRYSAAARFFWKTVVTTRSFATGGNADNEHFFPVDEFDEHVPSAKTMETCCSHNMLRLTRMLFTTDPTGAHADYYERTLYNTILASQDPDTGMMTYFQSTRPGYVKLYCTPEDSFWCCTGTGIENHAKYGDSIYFHGTEDGTDCLYVNLFIASTLHWKERGLALAQTTRFPEAGWSRLEVTEAGRGEIALMIRHPGWCAVATVKVNGAPVATSRNPGTYVPLKRTWKAGDVIDVDVPMALRMEPLRASASHAAVVYGPIVLAGALGHRVAPGADLHVNERTIGEPFSGPIEVPVLVGDLPTMAARIKPTDSPLTFRTDGLGRPADVTLVPYYRIAHEHYNLYWRIVGA
jgi:uncharacterized protein